MLRYIKPTYSEFTKLVKIAKKGQDDTNVVKMFTAVKSGNNITTETIYPCPATKIHFETNYDKSKNVIRDSNKNFGYPILNPDDDDYEELQMMVEVYPPMAGWKLTSSENMVLPATLSENVHYGKETVTIPVSTQSEAGTERRWIKVVPADDSSVAEPTTFDFYVKKAAAAGSSSASSKAWAYWSFDTDTPLVDKNSGIELSDPTNITNPMVHISNSGVVGKSLRCTDVTDAATAIWIDDVLYVRDTSYDNGVKFGWSDPKTNTAYKTDSSTPSSGDQVYDILDVAVEGSTVSELTATHDNRWSSPELDVDFSENSDQAFSMSLYHKQHADGGGRAGFFDYSDGQVSGRLFVQWAYNDTYGFVPDFTSQAINSKMSSALYGAPTTSNRFKHSAVSISRVYTYENDPYDPATGIGVKVWWQMKIRYKGIEYQYYVRSEADDANGRLAYKTDNADAIAAGVGTVWTEPEDKAYIGYSLTSDGEVETEVVNNIGPQLIRVHGWSSFTHQPLGIYVEQNFNYKSKLEDIGRKYRYYKFYVNGTRVVTHGILCAHNITTRKHFRIDLTSKNGKQYPSADDNGPKVDEIKLWRREVTDEEMAQEGINAGLYGASNASKAPTSTEPFNQHIVPTEITVVDENNVYRRDPELDDLYQDNLDTPRYGWRRRAGTGPECYWTAVLVPNVSTPCYLTVDAAAADMGNRVTTIRSLTKDDIDYSGLLHLQAYVLDKQTLAVAISFHDLIQNRMDEEYPYWPLKEYNYFHGFDAGWVSSWAKNGIILYVMAAYEPYLIRQLDTDTNWYFDENNNNTIVGRWFGASGYFRQSRRQYHNVKPGSKWYIDGSNVCIDANQPAIEGIQYAYIKLAEPMVEGTTHTLSILGNSVTFTFAANDPEVINGAIKINQEGYLPWTVARYAYLGQFMGSYGAFNPYLKITVTDGTSNSTYVKNYHKDVYSGKNTKFAWDKESGEIGPDTIFTTGSAPVLDGHIYTSSSASTEDESLTITSVPTFSLMTVPIKYGAGVDSYLVNHIDRQQIVYTKPIVQSSAYQKTTATSGLRASDIFPSGYAASRQSTDGECTFECNFTDFATRLKDKIVVDGTDYFRDVVEDYVYFELTIGGVQYARDDSKDTCNCYAWRRKSAGQTPEILYTRTDTDVSGRLMLSIPAVDDKASDTYEDNGAEYTITAVTTPVLIQGWTTERATEESWDNYTTIWTDSTAFYPSETTTFAVGNEPTAKNKAGETLLISSYVKDAECGDVSGNYVVYIPEVGWSYPFPIHVDSLGHMYWMYCRGMFNQRSGSYYHKRPYTNWEFQGAHPEFCYKGIYMLEDESTGKIDVCWQVDPVTRQDVLNASEARIGISAHFDENAKNDGIATPMCRELKGGWWDAADYDMRYAHIRCIDDLTTAFLYFPDKFCDNQLDLPESGDGIPDIINEAMWGIEVYRRSQTTDGGVCGWFEASGHESLEPDRTIAKGSAHKYYSCIPTRLASARYATAACRLARCLWYVANHTDNTELKKKANSLGDMYFESASNAFAFATKNIDPVTLEYIEEPEPVFYSIGTKAVMYLEPYSEGSKDKRQAEYIGAAAAIYAITKEDYPKSFLTKDNIEWHADYRHNMESYGYLSWELCLDCDDTIPDIAQTYRQKVIKLADQFATKGPVKNAYRAITRCPETEYYFYALGWGHAHPEFRGSIFPLAWKITGNTKYRDIDINGMDFVVGCNCFGMSWTTGLGKVYPVRNMSHNGYALQALTQYSTDPGISMYFYRSLKGLTYDDTKYSISLSASARTDKAIAFEGVSFSRTPALMAAKGATKDVCEAGPCWRYIAFWQESNSVAQCEYTIPETMSGKVPMTGIFLNKNWKPRAWYKQCRPAKTLFEDKCYLHLL